VSHATHEVHVNSLAAWHAGERSGFFNDRELEVLQAFHGREPSTDREIQGRCGYAEVAKVQPRISDLVNKGVLQEVGRKPCPVTGKKVRVCEIAPPPSLHQETFL
jgi:hypothetical protein